MTKVVCILIISILLAAFAPFSILVTAETQSTSIWDGTSADGFAGGRGTEEDPYRIETPEQLAYFRDQVLMGEDFADKYIKLCADIYLNNEKILYNSDKKTIRITNGIDTADYDIMYKRWQKDYTEEFRIWIPIGYNMKCFRGNFDGAGHTVSGAYIPFQNDQRIGLFGAVQCCTLKDLHVANSLIIGKNSAGGLVGCVRGENSYLMGKTEITRCSFDGVIVAESQVGGIVGSVDNTALLSLCENKGTIVGEKLVGGIVGDGDELQSCINNGDIYGDNNVGGISGQSGVGEMNISPVQNCTNNGSVSGNDNVGGICGNTYRSIVNCHNTGAVVGNGNFVGGICGGRVQNSEYVFSQCYNTGSVKGYNYVGGITGSYNVIACYNVADVIGNEYVGGISGYKSALNSKNTGTVTGKYYVGGVLGHGSVQHSCNYGAVIGNEWIGGVVGHARIVRNCYNRGAVAGKTGPTGGITGKLDESLVGCYNVGTVTGQDCVGTLIGTPRDEKSQLRYSFYRVDCAMTNNGVLQSYSGSLVQMEEVISVISLTDQEMMLQENYEGFNFETVWNKSDTYPTLRILETPHTATETVDANYLIKAASCTEAALYRAVCACGAVLDEFFAVGEPLGHQSNGDWQMNDTVHWQICHVCSMPISEQGHGFIPHEVVQNGKQSELILLCPDCGQNSHLSFEYTPPAVKNELPLSTAKAEFKLDLRFVILLSAGIALGAVGSYGVSVVKNARKDVKTKKKDFV